MTPASASIASGVATFNVSATTAGPATLSATVGTTQATALTHFGRYGADVDDADLAREVAQTWASTYFHRAEDEARANLGLEPVWNYDRTDLRTPGGQLVRMPGDENTSPQPPLHYSDEVIQQLRRMRDKLR